MADVSISLTVFINTDTNRIHLCAADGSGPNNFVAAKYSSKLPGDAFLEEFIKILNLYKRKFPRVSLSNLSLVLSDDFFITDMLTIPNLGKKAVENSLNLVVGTLYKNKNDLIYNTFPLMQNKQTAVYGMVGTRKKFVEDLKKKCEQNGITVQNVTFAANAMANGAMAANQKLRTATCLLLDIGENSARFAFLNKGRTLGAYSLPFGHAMLYKSQLAAEDLLFDYATAELLVLNAKEKARAKRLTVLNEPTFADLSAAPEATAQEGANATATPETSAPETPAAEVYAEPAEEVETRGGRKLPKYMLREMPTEPQGFVYENFRIFVKWALDIIASNSKITSLGKIDTVFVNMPKEYHFLFNMLNKEAGESKVHFAPMVPESMANKPLEMHGGFYVKQFNKLNNF